MSGSVRGGGAHPVAEVSEPPGVAVSRRPRLRYELLGCAVHGHALVSRVDADRSGHTDLLYRDGSTAEYAWTRCLRCDAWVPLTATQQPTATSAPVDEHGQLVVPLRGRPLRDRFVLRLIAVDRIVHFVLIGAIAVAIFLFANHRQALRGSYTRILNRLQGGVGGPLSDTAHSGLLHDFDRLFAVSTGRLYLYGVALAAYAAINGIEAFGLWWARRWAEYLTLFEVVVLVPVEIHELTVRVSVLKIITLLINLAVVAYLLWTHRLLGVRGGGRADQAEKDRDTGWTPLYRATPWASLPAQRGPISRPTGDIV